MKNLFISMPFTGRTYEEIMLRRKDIVAILSKYYGISTDNINVIDNYHHSNLPENAGRLEHLGESIKQMATADLVVFDYDWPNAPGCEIEMHIVNAYEIPWINVSRNLEV